MPEYFTKEEGEYNPMDPRSKNPWAEMGIGEWGCYMRLYGWALVRGRECWSVLRSIHMEIAYHNSSDLDSIYHPKLREL